MFYSLTKTFKIYLQVTSALLNLRQRNTYPGNPLPPWQKPQAGSSDIVGPMTSVDNFPLNNNQLASNVVEIVNNSRLEAHKLVHTALQVIKFWKFSLSLHTHTFTHYFEFVRQCLK